MLDVVFVVAIITSIILWLLGSRRSLSVGYRSISLILMPCMKLYIILNRLCDLRTESILSIKLYLSSKSILFFLLCEPGAWDTKATFLHCLPLPVTGRLGAVKGWTGRQGGNWSFSFASCGLPLHCSHEWHPNNTSSSWQQQDRPVTGSCL